MATGRVPGREFDPSAPVNSFLDTVLRVVTQPASFFGGLPRQGSFANPLIFALICLVIHAILSGILELAGVNASQFVKVAEERTILEKLVGFMGNLALTPILGGIGVFIGAALLQLLTRLVVGANNAGYRATFRVSSYQTVTLLVSWIPIVGWLLSLYGIYLSIVGIREVHQTTTGKAALVVLIPIGVILLLALLALLVVGVAFLVER